MFCCFCSKKGKDAFASLDGSLNPPVHREKKEIASLRSMERRRHCLSSSEEQSPGSAVGPTAILGADPPTCGYDWLRNRPQPEVTEGTGSDVVPPERWSCENSPGEKVLLVASTRNYRQGN